MGFRYLCISRPANISMGLLVLLVPSGAMIVHPCQAWSSPKPFSARPLSPTPISTIVRPSRFVTKTASSQALSPFAETPKAKKVMEKKSKRPYRLSTFLRVTTEETLRCLHPKFWFMHVRRGLKAGLVAAMLAVVWQRRFDVLAVQIGMASIVVRSVLIPVLYGSLFSVFYSSLSHGGNLANIWKECYFVIPWWISNKLIPKDDVLSLPRLLERLHADEGTLRMTKCFMESRQGGIWRLHNGVSLAHTSGVVVLSRAFFGPDLVTSPDFENFINFLIFARILDDLQDREEERIDGNLRRNYWLVSEDQYTDEDSVVEAGAQARMWMQWYRDQFQDAKLRQYCAGYETYFELMIWFKDVTTRRIWLKSRALADSRLATLADGRPPVFSAPVRWPFSMYNQATGDIYSTQ